MLIALDYDGTYTEAPDFWLGFIENAVKSGHKVICVTMRYLSEAEGVCEKLKKTVSIFYTGRKAKEVFLQEQGLKPNIWIDDQPAWIYQDSA